MNKYFIILIVFSIYSFTDFEIVGGAKVPKEYLVPKFKVNKGTKAVLVKNLSENNNSVCLKIYDDLDSLVYLIKYSESGVFEDYLPYFYFNNGRTSLVVNNQKSNLFHSVMYEKRDENGYVIEGAQIEILGNRLDEKIMSKYHFKYFDSYKTISMKYFEFLNNKDSILTLEYLLKNDSDGDFKGLKTIEYKDNKIVSIDSNWVIEKKIEQIDKYYIEKKLCVLSSINIKKCHTETKTYNVDNKVIKKIESDGSNDVFNNHYLIYKYDKLGRLVEVMEYDLINNLLNTEIYIYGEISKNISNPAKALNFFIPN
jgi:hypothetical protein